ncbi:MAG: hypothetical protein M1831_003426 [Alyxoria varia]|nr:MAG: hypothetical protein M1831_003426 [Alyxoria varia]
MSTIRNSIPSRSYRERPQPPSRAHKYPLLEKHKDYSKRARDHNAKQRQLKSLREKAASRNEDEFSFGMMSSRSEGGKMVKERKRQNKGGFLGGDGDGMKKGMGVSEEEVAKGLRNQTARRLKGQDLAWVRNERSKVRKMVKRAEETIRLNGSGGVDLAMAQEDGSSDGGGGSSKKRRRRTTTGPKHTIFVDDESQQKSFDPATHFNTTKAGVTRAWNRPRKMQEPPQPQPQPAQSQPQPQSQPPSFSSTAAVAAAAHNPKPSTTAHIPKPAPSTTTTTPSPTTASHYRYPAKSHAKLQTFLRKLKERGNQLREEELDLERQRAGMRKNQAGTVGGSKDGRVRWKVRGRAK